MAKILFAITSSFHLVDETIEEMKKLVEKGHNVIPVTSPAVVETNTRCGKGEDFRLKIEEVTKNNVLTTIAEIEPLYYEGKIDMAVVFPMTGNTLGKISMGISDSPASYTAKEAVSHNIPLVIGISTNDGLGFNGVNFAELINVKNVYVVPFGQDDHVKKTNSLVAHFDELSPTIDKAFEGVQHQPLIKEYRKK